MLEHEIEKHTQRVMIFILCVRPVYMLDLSLLSYKKAPGGSEKSGSLATVQAQI